MAVTYDGDCENVKILPTGINSGSLKNAGIFNTEKEDSIFKALVRD
jgi:hypothetical protein